MSDLRKAEIARLKWLFASVKWNIGQPCQPLGVPLKRQMGYVSCGIEAHFPGKHEQQFLEQYVSKLGTDSGTPYATDRSIYSREFAMWNSEITSISLDGSFPIRFGWLEIRQSDLIQARSAL